MEPQPEHIPTTQIQSKHEELGFEPTLVMSASVTLEEKFEAFMKNCEAMKVANEELKNQDEYLRCQLGELMK